ncbi:MAG: cupin domain-containing protein [Acidobacteriota bacterium]|nr:cupin domain-containing protein [Acidobacteriota bacterium]
MNRRALLALLDGAVQRQAASQQPRLTASRVFPYDAMPVRRMANGGESRDVLRGVLATGEAVAVHGSMQPAGMEPNPAHVIEHTEVMLVMAGRLEVRFNGTTQQLGPGGVFFIAKGTLHQVANVGQGAVRYVVVAIGGDITPA